MGSKNWSIKKKKKYLESFEVLMGNIREKFAENIKNEDVLKKSKRGKEPHEDV